MSWNTVLFFWMVEAKVGKAMSLHSSTLAWKIPWIEEPGRLQSMESLSWTRLSNFTFIFHFHALEKEMATHSSDLAWRIPGTGEPGGLSSMGSHRVGHDWSGLATAAAAEAKGVRWSERGVADSHCFYQACSFEIVSSTPIAPIQIFFFSILNSKWDFAACLRELKQGLCINLEEWDGERDGREFPKGGDICILWLIRVKVWQKTAKIL